MKLLRAQYVSKRRARFRANALGLREHVRHLQLHRATKIRLAWTDTRTRGQRPPLSTAISPDKNSKSPARIACTWPSNAVGTPASIICFLVLPPSFKLMVLISMRPVSQIKPGLAVMMRVVAGGALGKCFAHTSLNAGTSSISRR